MKINPTVSRGIVIVRNDGTIEMVPFQAFKSSTGGTILRIGNSTLWFDEDGSFDGTEHRLSRDSENTIETMVKMLAEESMNIGLAPDQPYFAREHDSNGYRAETADWPKNTEH